MDDPTQPSPRNVAQVRDRIDTGATGEKIDWPDPAASPLGTDAEAGGHPPTGEQVAMEIESASSNTATPRRFAFGAIIAYSAIACILLAAFAAVVWSN